MICINIDNLIFFPNVIKYVRPTYGNKEELGPLRTCQLVFKGILHVLKGPFTQSVSVSSNANANARMGVVLIHYTALTLPLMLMFCVNRLIHY